MEASTTATTLGSMPKVSLDDMLRAMKSIPAEPIGEWMRENGFPPDQYQLILPERMRDEVGPLPPRYVKFSPYISAPAFAMRLGF